MVNLESFTLTKPSNLSPSKNLIVTKASFKIDNPLIKTLFPLIGFVHCMDIFSVKYLLS